MPLLWTRYLSSPQYLCVFRVIRHWNNDNKYPLLMWFKKYHESNSDDDGYTYDSSSIQNY